MIEVDGSDGGGQLLRSALAFSAVTGEPLHMTDIRGARSTPGLRPQHVAVVRLLSDVCDATCSDVGVGTSELHFDPGAVRPGRYVVDIETAGSVTLLFDAVLPLATIVDDRLTIVARGGTDVKWSPSMAYYRQVKLPLLRRHGLVAIVEVDRPGFYPAGGGSATLRVAPSTLEPFDSIDRGEVAAARVYSTASLDLEDSAVGERQARQATNRLEDAGLAVEERTVRYADTTSPGSVISIRVNYEHSTAGFDAFGEPGVPAESVADEAVAEAMDFDRVSAAVDRHAGDQLLVFLALAGGQISIPDVTSHMETNRRLLLEFGYDLDIDRSGDPIVVRSG